MDLVRGRFKFNDAPMKQALAPYFKVKPSGELSSIKRSGPFLILQPQGPTSAGNSPSSWCSVPRLRVRDALAQAAAGRVCQIDLAALLHASGPRSFLDTLWSELCSATILGDLYGPRQVGLFVLTTSLPPPHPDLLPIFINQIVLKFATTASFDDQSIHVSVVELLAALVASALMVRFDVEKGMADKQVKSTADYFSLAKCTMETLRGSKNPMASLLSGQVAAFPSFSSYFSLNS
jgi:mediator of RNA polymerase II transcription subunit 5